MFLKSRVLRVRSGVSVLIAVAAIVASGVFIFILRWMFAVVRASCRSSGTKTKPFAKNCPTAVASMGVHPAKDSSSISTVAGR